MANRPRIASVAVLFHPERPEAIGLARSLKHQLEKNRISVDSQPAFGATVIADVVADKDLALALGGDGTILAVAREASRHSVCTLGVNLGRVGFLAETVPAHLDALIDHVIAGSFWTEHRTVIEATWGRGAQLSRQLALNEVAVVRGTSTRAIRVVVELDGYEYVTHTADGVMVATATGSTAYSLAAGGPILYPESRDLVLTPVAPHLHIGRSVVIPGDTMVRMRLKDTREAMLAIDGQTECPLESGDTVTVARSPHQALFARLGPKTYFYSVLSDRVQ
jgi:NAD+ kinase